VLDLGCGTSKDFPEALKNHPNVSYVGMEQNTGALELARRNLASSENVTLIQGFGENIISQYDGFFDIVLSLSVL